MKRYWPLAICSVVGMALAFTAFAAPENPRVFRAQLAGYNEVPKVATSASGKAMFELNTVGTEMSYELSVSKIKNPTAAHLHMARAGKSGPAVVQLYPKPPQGSLQAKNGVYTVKGVITQKNLTGPLARKPLSDLATQMADGNIYVNVHTKQNPNGEIRGQVTK